MQRSRGDGSRVDLLFRASGNPVDGISDYTERLREALVDVGVRVTVGDPGARGGTPASGMTRDDALVLQYNPFVWGRWGFAPGLLVSWGRAALHRGGPKRVLMIHEPYVPVTDVRSALMGGWQRFQLWALIALSDLVVVSIGPWTDRFRSWRPRRRVEHLPVGSNLPDGRAGRAESRLSLGVADDDLVVAGFGSGHPTWRAELFAQVARAVAAERRTTVLLLGAGAPDVGTIPGADAVLRPGRLEDSELAARLAAADLLIAPMLDGVSTRRTTVMAALQHGVPVVGTDGRATDDVLRGAEGVRLARAGDDAALAALALRVAQDPDERERSAAAARALYEREFSWVAIVEMLLGWIAELDAPAPRA